MAELKTKENAASVSAFLDKIDNEQKREDSYEIMKLMEEVTKQKAKMWGSAIIGFGSYHYKYESGREGDMCKIGFSPRKANISLYLMLGMGVADDHLGKLGKYKVSKGCLYINKLSDVDKAVLKKIIKASYDGVTKKYG
jgi:hypothetical protein